MLPEVRADQEEKCGCSRLWEDDKLIAYVSCLIHFFLVVYLHLFTSEHRPAAGKRSLSGDTAQIQPTAGANYSARWVQAAAKLEDRWKARLASQWDGEHGVHWRLVEMHTVGQRPTPLVPGNRGPPLHTVRLTKTLSLCRSLGLGQAFNIRLHPQLGERHLGLCDS